MGIEPRKGENPECRESLRNSKATLQSAMKRRKCEAGSARSETPSMCGNKLSENRESRSSPAKGSAGRVGESEDERR